MLRLTVRGTALSETLKSSSSLLSLSNQSELASMAMQRWSQERQIEWHYIAPGKPQQNTFIESLTRGPQYRPAMCHHESHLSGGTSPVYGVGKLKTALLCREMVSRRAPHGRLRQNAHPLKAFRHI
jgi:transposase InsO family protein